MLLELIRGSVNAGQFLAWIVGAALAITVHEYAHARRALAAGDATPLANGRVTLNPLAHYDPIGTTLLIVAGFGWAKPVPVDPRNFRSPRKDALWVSLWGPLSNVLLAAFLAIFLRLDALGPYTDAVRFIVLINCVLAVFNLIPIPPLDGSHVLSALLPIDAARRLDYFYARNGRFLMLAALFVLISGFGFTVLMIPIYGLYWLLTGSLF